MSSPVSFVPPPPPPPLNLKEKNKINEAEVESNNSEQCYISYDTAIQQIIEGALSELQSNHREDEAMVVFVTPLLRPLLQSGPICGFVAIMEAAEILGHQLNLNSVLDYAKNQKMTLQGELFCATDVMNLVKEFVPECNVTLTKTNTNLLRTLLQYILEGGSALLPYDADYNHGPSMRNGHAAHWAVLHGFGVVFSLPNILNLAQNEYPELISTTDSSKVFVVDLMKNALNNQTAQVDVLLDCCGFPETSNHVQLNMNQVYIIAHQGKSKRSHIWNFNHLMQSNQNLTEISPKIRNASDKYILKDINEGLCSKLLLLQKR